VRSYHHPFGTVQAGLRQKSFVNKPLPNSPIHHDDLEPSLLTRRSRVTKHGVWVFASLPSSGRCVCFHREGKTPQLHTCQSTLLIQPIQPDNAIMRAFSSALIQSGAHREEEESKPMTNEQEKSDLFIGAMKLANKPGRPGAESVEPRKRTGGNTREQHTCRTQSRESVSQRLDWYAELLVGLRLYYPRWEPGA
jgi:hypothetical protein